MEKVKGHCANEVAVQEQPGHQAAKVGVIMTPAWKGCDICMWIHATTCLSCFAFDVNWCDYVYDVSAHLKNIFLGETCWFSGVLGFLTSPHKVLDWQYLNRSLFETVSQTRSLLRVTEKLPRFALCHLTEERFFPSSDRLQQISGVQCGTCRLFCHRDQEHWGCISTTKNSPASPITRQKMVIHQVREGGREEELRDEGIKSGI